jgi:hypothetical protein
VGDGYLVMGRYKEQRAESREHREQRAENKKAENRESREKRARRTLSNAITLTGIYRVHP